MFALGPADHNLRALLKPLLKQSDLAFAVMLLPPNWSPFFSVRSYHRKDVLSGTTFPLDSGRIARSPTGSGAPTAVP